jgi:hypothetical protein
MTTPTHHQCSARGLCDADPGFCHGQNPQETKIAELAEVMPMDRAAGQAQSLGAKQHLEESGTARSDHKD